MQNVPESSTCFFYFQKRRDSLPKVSESEKARIRKQLGASLAAAAALEEKRPLKQANQNPPLGGSHHSHTRGCQSHVRRKLSFLRSRQEIENDKENNDCGNKSTNGINSGKNNGISHNRKFNKSVLK